MDVLAGLVPLATDVVITGADLSEIGAMIFPDPGQLSALGFNGESHDGIVTDANILAVFGEKLTEMQKFSASSSTRIARAVVLTEPASMPDGEMTAKGNLNFRKILTRRADILDHLYQGGQGVITLGK
jgi:feruloyl-CoA synthase